MKLDPKVVWSFVLAAAGAIAAVAVFVKNLLDIRKLRLEIERLRTELQRKHDLVRPASFEETLEFGHPLHELERRVRTVSLQLFVLFGLLSFVWLCIGHPSAQKVAQLQDELLTANLLAERSQQNLTQLKRELETGRESIAGLERRLTTEQSLAQRHEREAQQNAAALETDRQEIASLGQRLETEQSLAQKHDREAQQYAAALKEMQVRYERDVGVGPAVMDEYQELRKDVEALRHRLDQLEKNLPKHQ